MANKEIQVYDDAVQRSYKIKLLTVSSVLGAVVGILSAVLLLKNVEKTGNRPELSAREGLQLALLLFGVVRSVANLWEEK